VLRVTGFCFSYPDFFFKVFKFFQLSGFCVRSSEFVLGARILL
jgi:hypothetical protein